MDAIAAVGPAWGIPIGVSVYDVDGVYVGKVTAADSYTLTFSHGLIFPNHYEVPLGEVGAYDNGDLFLERTKAEVTATHVSRPET